MKARQFCLISVLIVMLLLSGCMKADTPPPPEPASPLLPAQEYARQVVYDVIGEKTNMGLPAIVSIDFEEGLLLLVLNGNDNLSPAWIRDMMIKRSGELFKALFKQQDVEEVLIKWQFPFVDVYGNESLEEVMIISMDRETEEKIKWDSMITENIPKIAMTYWVHFDFR